MTSIAAQRNTQGTFDFMIVKLAVLEQSRNLSGEQKLTDFTITRTKEHSGDTVSDINRLEMCVHHDKSFCKRW